MKRWVGIEMCLVLVLLSAMCGGGRTLALTTGAYEAFENAYLYQTMPESECLPVLPAAEPAPSQPYDSVTQANLQGRWVHRYQESGVSFEEILTVNGDTARIESNRIGLRTCARILEQLGGRFSRTDAPDRFTAELILPVEPPENARSRPGN